VEAAAADRAGANQVGHPVAINRAEVSNEIEAPDFAEAAPTFSLDCQKSLLLR